MKNLNLWPAIYIAMLMNIGAALFTLSSCSTSKGKQKGTDAVKYNFDMYNGKKVRTIKYCDGCGKAGDILSVYFTDGSELKVYAYKYNMEIQK